MAHSRILAAVVSVGASLAMSVSGCSSRGTSAGVAAGGAGGGAGAGAVTGGAGGGAPGPNGSGGAGPAGTGGAVGSGGGGAVDAGSATGGAGGSGGGGGGNSGTGGASVDAGAGNDAGATGGRGNGGSGGSAGASGPSGTPVVLSADGGWSWFQTPRALLYGTRLIVGSVSSGFTNAAIRGNVRTLVYDFGAATTSIFEQHVQLELDDHDVPALLIRPDGRLLSIYGKHAAENRFYYRVSQTADGLTWGAEQTFVPSATSSLTYNNAFLLTAENNRIYNFFRGLDASFKPSYVTSDDSGQTWTTGNIVINVPSTTTLQRPYVRYASNGTDTIHLIYTEAHPRDFDNSLYHVFYRAGSLYRSDGTRIAALTQGLAMPTDGTRIFLGDAQHVAWSADVVLDAQSHPVATYSVQVGSAGLPVGMGGDDIRYRYARWDGSVWHDFALAFAGSRLYSGEDDYSGLATLDPGDTSVVYISTNADPVTGVPLMSAADNNRHYEIFRGVTGDLGATWIWSAITHDSTVDNLRPLLPAGGDGHQKALLWLRGQYTAYTNYSQQVVALFWRQ